MEEKNIIGMLSKTDKILLSNLKNGEMFANEVELKCGLERAAVINSARKLLSLNLIKIESITKSRLRLTYLGQKYLKEGLPEYRVFCFAKKNKTFEYKQLFSSIVMDKDELNAAIGVLKRLSAIKVDGSKISVNLDLSSLIEERNVILKSVENNENVDYKFVQDFIKRGIIEQINEINEKFSITLSGVKIIKDPEFNKDYIDKISTNDIKNWQGLNFRGYIENPEIISSLSGKTNVKTKFISLIKNAMVSM